MNKITCLAIDDEPLALALIVGYIKRIPYLELCGEFDNPIDAIEYLNDNPIQLLFLDIQMPDLTGIDFARILEDQCKVIFMTAYEQYAVEGFQVQALDYLLKPISFERFLKATDHAKSYFDLLTAQPPDSDSAFKSGEEYLFVKVDYQLKRIEYDDILYFEGLKDYVQLFIKSSKQSLIIHTTMKSLEEKLPVQRFMRIHRSYMVNLDKVKTIERSHIIFGKERLPISKQNKERFDAFVKKRFL